MENWTKSNDLNTVLRWFAKGHKVQCCIGMKTWLFDLTKNNATIIMNQEMIQHGVWFVDIE
jgi:hypothetical protein